MSSINHFTVAELNLMGRLSQIAKSNNFLVSMAPSQSYLDYEVDDFDRHLLHSPSWKPGFNYHGKNVYSVLLTKYGYTRVPNPSDSNEFFSIPTFDFVSLQLYEGWSRAGCRISRDGLSITKYLNDLIVGMDKGWVVKFSEDIELGVSENAIVSVPAERLVIGLANGWAGPTVDDKFLLIWPSRDIIFSELSLKPRGFMFWNLQDEGRMVNGRKYEMVRELKEMYSGSPAHF
eukprot:TRINITY_DN6115_c0_g1_i4.p1 TRINITY_DN6115_c0_g1~~TRINITY_DN6115_c0_g1_i4.p1  ORF type:complete len:232 (-),score=29.99 TRINITY_DN6115_c0_g1_i4:208-903(-)